MKNKTQKDFNELVKLMQIARSQYESAIDNARVALNQLNSLLPNCERINIEKGFSIEEAIGDFMTAGNANFTRILGENKLADIDANGRKALEKVEEELGIPHQYFDARFNVGDTVIFKPLNTLNPICVRNNGTEVTILHVYDPLCINTNRMYDIKTSSGECLCVNEKELEERNISK